jgi:hypothetical protein
MSDGVAIGYWLLLDEFWAIILDVLYLSGCCSLGPMHDIQQRTTVPTMSQLGYRPRGHACYTR